MTFGSIKVAIVALVISFNVSAVEITPVGKMKLADSLIRVNTIKYDEISPIRITMFSSDLFEQSTQLHFLTVEDARYLQKILDKAIKNTQQSVQ